MRIFVTGATGFLGRHLCQKLLQKGFDVIAQGRNQQIGSELSSQGARFVALDLGEAAGLQQALKEVDAVIHCAALSSPWGHPQHFEKVNVEGTRNLLEGISKEGVRKLVHISTPSLYMADREQLNVRESDPLPEIPINHYARTKRLAEVLVQQASHQENFDYIILRPQGIFGPHDQAIFPRLIRVAKKGVFPVIGDGRTQLDLTYVDNVVHAIMLSLEKVGDLRSGVFNITNGQPLYLYDYLERLFKGLELNFKFKKLPRSVALAAAKSLEGFSKIRGYQSEPLLTHYGVTLLSRSRTLDITQAKEKLGYAPLVSLDDGLQTTIDWFKKVGLR